MPYACRIKAPLSSVMLADGVTGHWQSASRNLMYMHIHHWRPSLYQTVTRRVILIINSLRPRQNGRHFADDIFNGISLIANVWIPIKISLKYVPRGPINNIPALVRIMVWRRPGDKPLSEPMMDSLPTHICVIRPQWVNAISHLTKGGSVGSVGSVSPWDSC